MYSLNTDNIEQSCKLKTKYEKHNFCSSYKTCTPVLLVNINVYKQKHILISKKSLNLYETNHV